MTSGRSDGNDKAKHLSEQMPRTIPSAGGYVKGGMGGERPASSKRGRAMAQPWSWVAARRSCATGSTLVRVNRMSYSMELKDRAAAQKGSLR